MKASELREKAKIINDLVNQQKYMEATRRDPSAAFHLLTLTTLAAVLDHLADVEAYLVRD